MHWSHHANATPLPMQHAICNMKYIILAHEIHIELLNIKLQFNIRLCQMIIIKLLSKLFAQVVFLKIVPIPWSLSTNTESNLVCKWALFGFVVFFRSFFMRMHKYKWFKIDSKCETDCDAHFVANIWPCMDRKLRAISNLFAINVKMLPLLLFFLSLFNGIGWKL